mmetsp:Transcript_21192/g.59194  ORF Transcript_21192/g.59194 Transcript_21192/m.59194 type:complete len:272 (+) Transcript_21192:716-1531(+)
MDVGVVGWQEGSVPRWLRHHEQAGVLVHLRQEYRRELHGGIVVEYHGLLRFQRMPSRCRVRGGLRRPHLRHVDEPPRRRSVEARHVLLRRLHHGGDGCPGRGQEPAGGCPLLPACGDVLRPLRDGQRLPVNEDHRRQGQADRAFPQRVPEIYGRQAPHHLVGLAGGAGAEADCLSRSGERDGERDGEHDGERNGDRDAKRDAKRDAERVGRQGEQRSQQSGGMRGWLPTNLARDEGSLAVAKGSCPFFQTPMGEHRASLDTAEIWHICTAA